jgi:transcriptional regulator GlxA family with amidase domain
VSLADQALVVVHRRIEEPLTPNELAETLYVSLRTLERVWPTNWAAPRASSSSR